MNNFGFLQAEWPELHESATRAEGYLAGDPRTACFHARRALELAVTWLYRHETALRLPYQETLSALVYEPTFKATAGEAIFQKAALIISKRPLEDLLDCGM